jgi:hypothetical protein
MKDVFYGLLVALISMTVWIHEKEERYCNLHKFEDCVIADIKHSHFYGYRVQLLYPSGKTEPEYIHPIAVINYQIGDTIK